MTFHSQISLCICDRNVHPASGPPLGGNTVDIYGLGFDHDTVVAFGGVTAGDLVVRNCSHVTVRAPAGNFGYVDGSVLSAKFPDETGVLQSAYFYANASTGSVGLSQEGHRSGPVAAIALKGQALFVATGGGYIAVDVEGRELRRFSTSKGQLVVADVYDPVHLELIYKETADGSLPYHMDVPLAPEGFVAMAP